MKLGGIFLVTKITIDSLKFEILLPFFESPNVFKQKICKNEKGLSV